MKEYDRQAEALLEAPCHIVDFLPQTVSEDAPGQYFAVERYWLESGRHGALVERFAGIILKLMCYYHMAVDEGGWMERPDPALIDCIIAKIAKKRTGTLNCLFPDENALLVLDGNSLNLAVYNPNGRMRALLAALAQSEGLFWRPAAF